jgi:hypothetical protein
MKLSAQNRMFRKWLFVWSCPTILVLPSAGQARVQETARGQYAGSVSCRQCHERFYELWAPSHHGLAMQPHTAKFADSELIAQERDIEISLSSFRAFIGAGEGYTREDRLGEMPAYVSSAERDEVFAASLIRLLPAGESEAKWPVAIKTLEEDASPLMRAAAAQTLDGQLTAESLRALSAAAYAFLASICLQRGDREKAIGVYRAAQASEQLDPGVRNTFNAMMLRLQR